jgi:SAM-dependent methyltransferase
VARAELTPGARILEIGCGTGQITLPLAARGYVITALEPGDALAALAARKCRPYPQVEVVPTSFEAWPLQAGAFDLVLAAQAFHWIEPKYGCARAAAALRARGGIALVWYLDVSQSTAFWQATLPIYDACFPPAAPGDPPLSDKVSWYEATLRESSELLNTFSDHRALREPHRTTFFRAITDTIARFGGEVRRLYETILIAARKR